MIIRSQLMAAKKTGGEVTLGKERVNQLVYGQDGDKSKRRQVKRRHRNGDRNGYGQNGDKPKQHLYSSSEAYIIDRRLYT